MNTTHKTYLQGDVLKLVRAILDDCGVGYTESVLLRQIHDNLEREENILNSIKTILGTWRIDANYVPLDMKMIHDIPCPSLIVLSDHALGSLLGHVYMLVSVSQGCCKIFNPSEDLAPYEVTMEELKSRWTPTVLVLDTSAAKDENGYSANNRNEQILLDSEGGISVLMPVYNQACFVEGAIKSILLQTYENWELLIIDDGSKDFLWKTIEPYLTDKRISYFRNDVNEGLGHCLNIGLDRASFDTIAYLPADDIFLKDHLRSLVNALVLTNSELAFSGIKYNFSSQLGGDFGEMSFGRIENLPLQLVQVMHKKGKERWTERSELVTDDLDRMFWNKISENGGKMIGSYQVTCEWVDHARQRHKIINDRLGGGIYRYKKFYEVNRPIRFQSLGGNFVDEISHFHRFRRQKAYESVDASPLKILIVGELAYNAERIVALERSGHKLYGLWIDRPANFNAIGPLPFGDIEDIPSNGWQEKVAEIKPDIIYALLNYHAVPLAYQVLKADLGIPFVWHFKEGPFFSRAYGTWEQLVFLYQKSDGQIYINELSYEWFRRYVSGDEEKTLILDGDLPSAEWFGDERSALLSESDGEIHTLIAGRPIGIFPSDIVQLASQKIHIHLYGDVFHGQFKEFIDAARYRAPKFVHLHANCTQENWVKEFSQYDAGWLHCFQSKNKGDVNQASWHDLNAPARMSTYAAAGLPMLVKENDGHRVACNELLEKYGMALKFNSFGVLSSTFSDRQQVATIREQVWKNRARFCFDYHVDNLITFFRKTIDAKRCNRREAVVFDESALGEVEIS